MASKAFIRPATAQDIPKIKAIHDHYVYNSVLTLHEEPRPENDISRRYSAVIERGLPYLVAQDEESRHILGYAYAFPFNRKVSGLAQTVEINLLCHPNYTRQHIARNLLEDLLAILRRPQSSGHANFFRPGVKPYQATQVIACICIDELGPKGGLGLIDWYKQFGFQENGRFKKVGCKFDRWIDQVYLQVSLI
ncbi:MAG: hypothetical protein M1820_008943 [Bogoriella megaspora]|nr:MAG: hypothetical protein M1820_008943 [Bogoriella megaspora]